MCQVVNTLESQSAVICHGASTSTQLLQRRLERLDFEEGTSEVDRRLSGARHTPISGLRVSSFGSLPTTSNPTLRRCSLPSSKVCHQQVHVFVMGSRNYVHHAIATSTLLGTTAISKGSKPSDHVLQNLPSHCRSFSPSPASRHQ